MSKESKFDDEHLPPKRPHLTWNPNATQTLYWSTTRPANVQNERHIIVFRTPAVQDTDLPVTFDEFWKNTNISKIAEMELKRQHPLSYERMIKNEEHIKTLALDYYRIHFVKPECRSFKPLSYFHVKPTCPPELRRQMFKKVKLTEHDNAARSTSSKGSRTVVLHKVSSSNVSVYMDKSGLFKVPRIPPRKTKKVKPVDSDSEDEGGFGENKSCEDPYVGLEARPSEERIDIISPSVEGTASNATVENPEKKYTQMFVVKDANITVLEPEFPVCYSVFKEYTSYHDIVGEIEKKITNELGAKLQLDRRISHRIFHNYYKQFYLNPSIRSEFPYKFDEMCPAYLRRKILETPNITKVRRKLLLEDLKK